MGLKLDQSSYECVFFIGNSEQVKGQIQSRSGLALGGKKRQRRQRKERCLVDYNDKECDGRKIRSFLSTSGDDSGQSMERRGRGHLFSSLNEVTEFLGSEHRCG